MRRRGIKKGPNNHRGDEEDDSGCNSESRNILAVPVDDYDNLTDCEEFYDDDTDDVKRRSSHCFSASEDDRNGEYLTDIEYSSDEDDCPSKQPETSSKVPRRSAKEISLYIQRVLGRPLRAVTCFKEREQGGTLIQTEQVDCEDEVTDDETSRCDELPVNIPESSPDSEMSDIEASDIDSDTEDDIDRGHNNNDSNIIDDYLQGHFARLSSTDHDSRGKRNSEIDESLLAPGIVVSKCGELASDASHPVTEEEILSEREVSHKPINVRSKRRITRGQFAKQSNYLTASLPTVGQGETDSESESDGRQFIRSSFQQYNSRSMNQDDDVSPEAQDNLSNLPSTDSESFELEDEDAPLNDDFQLDSASVESEKRPKDVKIVSQISSEEIID